MTNNTEQALKELESRLANTQDDVRLTQAAKRHTKGFNTARENVDKLCSGNLFREYGQLAVAAQRQRRDYEELQTETAADGVITGISLINNGFITLGNKAKVSSHDTVVISII
jgi:acetyl-CoA carboxylase carboxyltransferase component